jgi:ubiquinone/menaquinone biosynthesis C-methylase UbiE
MIANERLPSNEIEQYAVEHLHRYLLAAQIVKGKTVVDIASGEGYGSRILANYGSMVTGVDIDNSSVEKANRKYQKENLRYIQGDCLSIPLEDNSVDIVSSFETIEHHDQHHQMIKEIKRILKPDGILIMSTPEKKYFTDIPKANNPYHLKELYFNELKDLLTPEFKSIKFLFQRSSLYSIISSEDAGSFLEYGGDFSQQYISEAMTCPVYNLVICSNSEELPHVGSSCFNGDVVLKELDTKYWVQHHELNLLKRNFESLNNSISFKIGRLITSPFRLFKP